MYTVLLELSDRGRLWTTRICADSHAHLVQINPRGQLRLSRKAVLIEDDPSLQVEEKVDKTPVGAVWTPKKEE